MKFFSKGKDGGPKSTVTGYWLIEVKKLFSIVLLKFEHGSRDEFHNHAFNSVNWVLKGDLYEEDIGGGGRFYRKGLKPIKTWRRTFHRVRSIGTSWVLSFRGPWNKYWTEYSPKTNQYTTLTNGRKTI